LFVCGDVYYQFNNQQQQLIDELQESKEMEKPLKDTKILKKQKEIIERKPLQSQKVEYLVDRVKVMPRIKKFMEEENGNVTRIDSAIKLGMYCNE